MANYKRLTDYKDSSLRAKIYQVLQEEVLGLLSNDVAGTAEVNLSNLDINCLTEYLGSYTIESLLLMQVNPKSTTGIRATANQPTYCYLMLPIIGINKLTVAWYRSSSKGKVVNNELVFKKDQCLKIDGTALDGTSLIKTYIPYEINNPNPYKSIILAVKFKPEPIEMLDGEIFARMVK